MTGTGAEQSSVTAKAAVTTPEEAAAPQWPCARSVELICECGLKSDDPIVDASGSSELMESLLAAGYRDITVLQPSVEALERLRARVGDHADCVTLVSVKPGEFRPRRRYALWHDAGVFECLLHPEERQQYVETVQQALRPEGYLVLMTSGPNAPPEHAGHPIRRYSAQTLPAELGSQFELSCHGLAQQPASGGPVQELLHCRFTRHAPRWPN
jgi:hypothetical protein